MPIEARTKSPDDTIALAAEVAALVRPGDVVLLVGELGTGKTVFAKGFGAGLGVDEVIASPTFVLERCYEGRMPLLHVDVYRLDRVDEAIDLALQEQLDDGAVALIEWGDKMARSLPADFLEVRLTQGAGDDERLIRLRTVGPRWSNRAAALRRSVERWIGEPA